MSHCWAHAEQLFTLGPAGLSACCFVRFFNLMSLSYLHVAGYLRLGGGGWQPPLRFRHGLPPRGIRDGRVGVRACPLKCPADPGAQDLPRAAGMDGLHPPADPTREGAGIQHQPMARSVRGLQPRGPSDLVMGGDCSGMHPRGGAESELYQQPRGGSASLRQATRVVIGGPKIGSKWGCERPSPGDSCDCPKADVGGGAVPGTKGRGPQEPPKQSQRWAFRRGRGALA